MPTLEIDGQRIEVPDGLTVIQAAERLGIEIPHYCWHPGLSIAGNCRMCLVEIEKNPKLQIACNTRVADGMVVRTTSEKTKAAQRAVLEFLLINHPIDCPVCDQAGECKLQEYYMDYDRQRSRFPLPAKVRKKKAIPIGPLVMLDQERCILCARCTRFLDEVTHTSELAIYERGDHCEIELAPGRVLDNPYSGNVVDICPVGALTSRDFRFRARVWYLERAESVCGACANGCNIEIYDREGRIFRFQPRQNLAVNQYWMCDAGRLSYRDLQGEGRLTHPLVRGAMRPPCGRRSSACRASSSWTPIGARPRNTPTSSCRSRRTPNVTARSRTTPAVCSASTRPWRRRARRARDGSCSVSSCRGSPAAGRTRARRRCSRRWQRSARPSGVLATPHSDRKGGSQRGPGRETSRSSAPEPSKRGQHLRVFRVDLLAGRRP